MKCALHEGVQDFKRGRVCYGLLLGVRDSSGRAHEECYVGWRARSVCIEGYIIGCGSACQELRARFRGARRSVGRTLGSQGMPTRMSAMRERGACR